MEGHGGVRLSGLLPMACSVCFFVKPSTTWLVMGPGPTASASCPFRIHTVRTTCANRHVQPFDIATGCCHPRKFTLENHMIEFKKTNKQRIHTHPNKHTKSHHVLTKFTILYRAAFLTTWGHIVAHEMCMQGHKSVLM